MMYLPMSHSNFRVLVLMQVHQGKRPDVIADQIAEEYAECDSPASVVNKKTSNKQTCCSACCAAL